MVKITTMKVYTTFITPKTYIFNALENHSRKPPVYKGINMVFHFGGRDDLVGMSLHSAILS